MPTDFLSINATIYTFSRKQSTPQKNSAPGNPHRNTFRYFGVLNHTALIPPNRNPFDRLKIAFLKNKIRVLPCNSVVIAPQMRVFRAVRGKKP